MFYSEILSCRVGAPWANSDTWSLAIVLLNLITSASPWIESISEYSKLGRYNFQSFYANYNFSDSFKTLLGRVFCPTHSRISLEQFQQDVNQLSSFYSHV